MKFDCISYPHERIHEHSLDLEHFEPDLDHLTCSLYFIRHFVEHININ